ncbi:ribonuclease t2 [Xylaria bambusicola]|uniref:ribonuclease t2 n=1 Tax=Xylaria bambusicola TaxID=326684 RepID=UPI0020077A0F|nr:ribonuclease t2 [Xylaria bambusicola]KAI0516829.1 ribonuclease t2 [Xylaria bambusicola]
MFSKIAVTGLAVVGSAAAASVSCPADLPYSCSNTTVVEDLCCFEAPGGAVLLTQFWDTAPSTGPSDSWTLHGLWPDNCDGTYEQNCDPNRAYTNITDILKEKAPCTLKAMQVYWKDYKGNDESFWQHEFGKHGTCMSTLEPQCYSNYQPTDEVADYFTRAVDLFKSLPTYDWLAAAGIVPSSTATYTLAAIQAALTAHHGQEVVIRCSGSSLNELWYHYRVRGSIQSGDFAPVVPVGSGSTCPKTGIKYLPKYAGSTPTTTTTTKGSTPTPTATSVPTGVPGALAGKGYVKVLPDGFMISAGNWYRASGTPATYTATPSGDGKTFALKTSKGPCQILADASLSCAAGNAESSFGYDGKYLTYDGASTFYVASAPGGQDKGVVFTTQKAVSLQMYWQPL